MYCLYKCPELDWECNGQTGQMGYDWIPTDPRRATSSGHRPVEADARYSMIRHDYGISADLGYF